MTRRTILMTGAAGRIGRVLTTALADRYALLLTDAQPLEAPGTAFVQADLAEAERLAALCRGVDTVLHLAASSDLTTSWEPILRNNIIGCHHLFRAAAEGRCRRVVLASSIHAVDAYPKGASPIDGRVRALPRTLYGASKAWAEALASVHAHGGSLSAICLRLGWVMPGDDALIHLDNDRLDVVLTHADLVRLFVAAIEAPDDLRYGVFYGLSNNRRNRYDLEETRRHLRYEPRDDAFAIADGREPGGAGSRIRAARRLARRILRRG
jgi:uronate dehydrogenase